MPQIIARVHSDHTMTECMTPGFRRLDGNGLGHTHIKSAYKWLPEALWRHYHLVLLPSPKVGTHFVVQRWVDWDNARKGAIAHAQSHCPRAWPTGARSGGVPSQPRTPAWYTQRKEVSAFATSTHQTSHVTYFCITCVRSWKRNSTFRQCSNLILHVICMQNLDDK